LKDLGEEDREIYLYDTFTGMSEPSDADVSVISGKRAEELLAGSNPAEDSSVWCESPLAEVKNNVFQTGYTQSRFHFVEGKVEDTIPSTMPEEIALLRLDTDWYESTKHELVHLFPLLSPKGIVIFDDYGHWQGARQAVDEYISEQNLCIFLSRIDYSGRIAVKMPN
jgi:hypothetical protein